MTGVYTLLNTALRAASKHRQYYHLVTAVKPSDGSTSPRTQNRANGAYECTSLYGAAITSNTIPGSPYILSNSIALNLQVKFLSCQTKQHEVVIEKPTYTCVCGLQHSCGIIYTCGQLRDKLKGSG